jgi:hypothetical protein
LISCDGGTSQSVAVSSEVAVAARFQRFRQANAKLLAEIEAVVGEEALGTSLTKACTSDTPSCDSRCMVEGVCCPPQNSFCDDYTDSSTCKCCYGVVQSDPETYKPSCVASIAAKIDVFHPPLMSRLAESFNTQSTTYEYIGYMALGFTGFVALVVATYEGVEHCMKQSEFQPIEEEV